MIGVQESLDLRVRILPSEGNNARQTVDDGLPCFGMFINQFPQILPVNADRVNRRSADNAAGIFWASDHRRPAEYIPFAQAGQDDRRTIVRFIPDANPSAQDQV